MTEVSALTGLTLSPIPYGLRKEEIVFEVINSLELLSKIIETVFESIDKKISCFGPTLSDINYRAANCRSKVNQLKEWETRATKVFSSHKYPNTDAFNEKTVFKSVCNEINGNFKSKLNIQSSVCDLNNNSKRFGQLIPFDESLIDEKIKFFNVDSGSKNKNTKTNPLFSRIGSIRWHRIHSLSSLLIFNTSEIAFVSRSQKSVDLRQNQSRDVVDHRKRLDSAPKSMTNPVEDINQIHFLNSSSGPKITDDLPTALPSLPGIADEFVSDSHNVYQMDGNDNNQNQSLLPNFLPVLPNFETLSISTNLKKSDPSVKLTSNIAINSLPISPPPPPPPPVIIGDTVGIQVKVIPSVIPPPPPPPPPLPQEMLPPVGAPPPPPPPFAGPPPPPPATSGPPKANPMPVSADNSRASLLDAIRNAGGKPKPKTIKDKKMDKKLQMKESKELGNSKPSSGGDLMSDLMSRLALRRDGISGNQKTPKQSARPPKPPSDMSAMERISAMIPPPIPDSGDDASEPEDDWID